MFRLVADITELNIDQVKLPKIPGLGMLMKFPNKQKNFHDCQCFECAERSVPSKMAGGSESEVGAVATFGLSGGTAGGRKLSGAHPD